MRPEDYTKIGRTRREGSDKVSISVWLQHKGTSLRDQKGQIMGCMLPRQTFVLSPSDDENSQQVLKKTDMVLHAFKQSHSARQKTK